MHLSPQPSPLWVFHRFFLIAFSSLPMSHTSSWSIDSGPSSHMSSVDHHFGMIKPYAGHEHSTAANCQHLSISGSGSICLLTPQNQSFPLSSVFFVPK